MSLNWIAGPVVQYGLLAGGMLASLALFISGQAEISSMRRKAKKAEGVFSEAVRSLEEQVEELRAGLSALAEESGSTRGAAARAQVVKMHRRGESVESIAEALGARQGEVALMLKLEQMLRPSTQDGAGA